jgi:hypothetical protein
MSFAVTLISRNLAVIFLLAVLLFTTASAEDAATVITNNGADINNEETSTTTAAAASTLTNEMPMPLQQPESWQNDLVNWLISKPNGYFSDQILWIKTEMGFNMHAANNIPKGTTLMIIPQAALITSDGTDEECITIVKMMREYEKGESSDYYPYIRYLFGGHDGGTSTGLLPTTWSDPAKTLLRTMLGTELYPQKFDKGQRRVLKDCKDFLDRKDDVEHMDQTTAQRWQDAYIFWLSRSWSDKMVPILDMINHRNGKWLNVESTTAHAGRDIRVYALRDIEKGEQLWSKYLLFYCVCVYVSLYACVLCWSITVLGHRFSQGVYLSCFF